MGSAARETKCQVLSNGGGAAVRIPTLTSAGKEFAKAASDAAEIEHRIGNGTQRGTWLDV